MPEGWLRLGPVLHLACLLVSAGRVGTQIWTSFHRRQYCLDCPPLGPRRGKDVLPTQCYYTQRAEIPTTPTPTHQPTHTLKPTFPQRTGNRNIKSYIHDLRNLQNKEACPWSGFLSHILVISFHILAESRAAQGGVRWGSVSFLLSFLCISPLPGWWTQRFFCRAVRFSEIQIESHRSI